MEGKAPVLVQFNTSIEEDRALVVVWCGGGGRKRGIWPVGGRVRMCKESQDWVEMIRDV